jgi:hypothetical protein
LQIPGAVKPRGQAEVAIEERPGSAEQVEQFITCHRVQK